MSVKSKNIIYANNVCKWIVNIYNERTFYNQTTKIQPSCSSTKCPEGGD